MVRAMISEADYRTMDVSVAYTTGFPESGKPHKTERVRFPINRLHANWVGGSRQRMNSDLKQSLCGSSGSLGESNSHRKLKSSRRWIQTMPKRQRKERAGSLKRFRCTARP